MKKVFLLAFAFALMTSASHAQSFGEVVNAVANALGNSNQKEDNRHKIIDAGGQVALSVPKDVQQKDISRYYWSVSDRLLLYQVESNKTSCVLLGLASTPSTVVTYKYTYKSKENGKEEDKDGTVTYTIKINKVAPTSLNVNQETSVGWGTYEQLKTILKPDYSQAELQYTSENPNIVRVGADGKMYGVAMGETYITIRSDNGLEAETHVTCKTPAVSEVTITGYDKKMKLYDGDQLQLGYTYAPEHAKAEVRWQTSDQHIATVDETGLVTFVGNGTVHIFCTDKSGVKADLKLKPKKNKNKD